MIVYIDHDYIIMNCFLNKIPLKTYLFIDDFIKFRKKKYIFFGRSFESIKINKKNYKNIKKFYDFFIHRLLNLFFICNFYNLPIFY